MASLDATHSTNISPVPVTTVSGSEMSSPQGLGFISKTTHDLFAEAVDLFNRSTYATNAGIELPVDNDVADLVIISICKLSGKSSIDTALDFFTDGTLTTSSASDFANMYIHSHLVLRPGDTLQSMKGLMSAMVESAKAAIVTRDSIGVTPSTSTPVLRVSPTMGAS